VDEKEIMLLSKIEFINDLDSFSFWLGKSLLVHDDAAKTTHPEK